MPRLMVTDGYRDRLVTTYDYDGVFTTEVVNEFAKKQLFPNAIAEEHGWNHLGCREWWVRGYGHQPQYILFVADPDEGRFHFGFEDRIKKIVQRAGKDILKREVLSVSNKEGHANFVTNVDCAVQKYLESALTHLIPASKFIGEEKEEQKLTDDLTWIVDPVDGTTNLIHDYRTSAISVALCENKEPIIGIIWQPFTKEWFYAEKGKGAFLNGRQIHVAENDFSDALVAIGTAPYYEELEETSILMAGEFLHCCADIRRSGSAAIDLANLAAGRTDAYFEMRLKPWDYAAGSLIVQEAGGEVRMPLLGTGMDFDQSTAIVAATPRILDQVMEVFWKYNKKQSDGI